MEPIAMIAVPAGGATFKGAGCALTSHSGVGLYEVTLDQPLAAAECVAETCCFGAVADQTAHIEHVSDTVKRVHTNLAAPSDAVAFSAVFFRVPAGH